MSDQPDSVTHTFTAKYPEATKVRDASLFHADENSTLSNTFKSASLYVNDELVVNYTMNFTEPRPLSKMEKVIKVFKDKIDYLAGYRLNLININDTCDWD